MVPTIFAVRPTQTMHSLVGSSGLNCLIESLCGFWKVGRVQECLPSTMLKILQSHATVVRNALIELGGFAGRVHRPDEARYRFEDLTEFVFAFSQCVLGPLALHVLDPHRFVSDFQSLVGVANSRYQEVDDD